MGKKKNGHSATETCDKYSFANKGPVASDELGVSREPAIDFESCEGVRDADKGIIWYDGLPTFNEIRSFLDKTIIGQDEAKDMAALLLADHMRGTTHTFLFSGPSGCGKSEIWRQLASEYDQVPIKIISTTSLAADGWNAAGGFQIRDIFDEIPAEERGHAIIVFDEFDKVCCETYGTQTSNFSGTMQNSLLKLLDRDPLHAPRDRDHKEHYTLKCEGLSFVLLGSFAGLVEKRHAGQLSGAPKETSFGFGAKASREQTPKAYEELDNTLCDDEAITEREMIKAGMRPELCGRINCCIAMQALDHDSYVRIGRNYVSKLAENRKCRIEIDDETLDALADDALKKGLGARYMKSSIERALDRLRIGNYGADCYYLSR